MRPGASASVRTRKRFGAKSIWWNICNTCETAWDIHINRKYCQNSQQRVNCRTYVANTHTARTARQYENQSGRKRERETGNDKDRSLHQEACEEHLIHLFIRWCTKSNAHYIYCAPTRPHTKYARRVQCWYYTSPVPSCYKHQSNIIRSFNFYKLIHFENFKNFTKLSLCVSRFRFIYSIIAIRLYTSLLKKRTELIKQI